MQSRPDHGASMATDEFSRDPSGLPEAGRPELLELAGGDTPAAARRPGGQAEHRTPTGPTGWPR